jgi:hypothetical protein
MVIYILVAIMNGRRLMASAPLDADACSCGRDHETKVAG